MKHAITILAFFLIAIRPVGAQVETEIESKRVFDLSVIQVFPDSFPIIQVVFQARDSTGIPLWDIEVEDLTVSENGDSCQIIDLVNISQSEIIDIALVFDHSGSMGYPYVPDSMHDHNWTPREIDSLWQLPLPIEHAKNGVRAFISSSELQSDSILIAGFSSYTDSIIGPTQDTTMLASKVNSMYANFGTAFYDALIHTMTHLAKKSGQKSAIVALTDGLDNESKNTVSDVIEKSADMQIPIYIIGLGNVWDSTLTMIADSANGLYYKTDDPEKLQEIYLNISRQLKSVYALDYQSNIAGFAGSEHSITFGFTNDTLLFSNPDIRLTLPDEVLTYIHKQEEERIEAERNQNLVIGGIGAGILAIGLTTFLLYRRKKTRVFKIAKVYPNPFQNELNIVVESNLVSEKINVQVVDFKGNIVFQGASATKEVRYDLSHLSKGIYVIQAIAIDGMKDTRKVVRR